MLNSKQYDIVLDVPLIYTSRRSRRRTRQLLTVSSLVVTGEEQIIAPIVVVIDGRGTRHLHFDEGLYLCNNITPLYSLLNWMSTPISSRGWLGMRYFWFLNDGRFSLFFRAQGHVNMIFTCYRVCIGVIWWLRMCWYIIFIRYLWIN
jgi:hypothetical protein